MSACIDATKEMEMKPFEQCRLICNELELDDAVREEKPKEIVAHANLALKREHGEGTNVKEEAQAVRQILRDQPPSFWGAEEVGKGKSSPQALVQRLLLKPASSGGFCSGVACKRLKNKCMDTKTLIQSGACSIDGFDVLPSAGQFSNLDFELGKMAKLFGSKTKDMTFGHCVFSVLSREQVAPGSSVVLCKGNKCNARLAALLTPKFLLVGFYNYGGSPDTEAKTIAILEDLRLEAEGK
jgi:hypothetical protein